jgi:hypothetical protein
LIGYQKALGNSGRAFLFLRRWMVTHPTKAVQEAGAGCPARNSGCKKPEHDRSGDIDEWNSNCHWQHPADFSDQTELMPPDEDEE